MTLAFDNKARETVRQLSIPTYKGRVKELQIYNSFVAEARGWIAEYHYHHKMPDSTKEVFKFMYGKELAGFSVFGMGAGKYQYTRIPPDLQNGEYRELTRLWSPDGMPHNTESKMIGLSLRQLPRQVRLVLSYADEERGHLGIIYQATNWMYLGETSGFNKVLIDKNGQEWHPRLVQMYQQRHPNTYGKLSFKEVCDARGWVVESRQFKKHRYVFIPRQSYLHRLDSVVLKPLIKPYPKFIHTGSRNSNGLGD